MGRLPRELPGRLSRGPTMMCVFLGSHDIIVGADQQAQGNCEPERSYHQPEGRPMIFAQWRLASAWTGLDDTDDQDGDVVDGVTLRFPYQPFTDLLCRP